MRPVLTNEEMRTVDSAAARTGDVTVLVQRAGTAVGMAALDMLGGAYGRRVTVLAGRGNNGADGRVAAGLLARRGASVTVVEAAGAPARLEPADLVVDAAYGTGFRGEFTAPAIDDGTRVLAVDIPSGVDGDSGEVSGRAWRAERTVTFAALKPGLLQADGVGLAGRVDVADIGLATDGARAHLMEDADIACLVAPRRRDDNKWTSAVLVVAGSPGMTGAAGLCARAASRAGAGMVRLGVPGAAPGSPEAPEAVGVALPAEGWAAEALTVLDRCRAVVVGPGLGRADSVAADVRRLVAESPVPVVVDADALFALGTLDARLPTSEAVLTPHDGEYRRLAGDVPGRDRLAAARSLAARAGAVVLVKGSTTTVAVPDGQVLISTAGSSRLATAGTGDVLSGVIGALLARGVPAAPAAALASHIHGRAASLGRSEGLVAGDLPDLVADVLSGRHA